MECIAGEVYCGFILASLLRGIGGREVDGDTGIDRELFVLAHLLTRISEETHSNHKPMIEIGGRLNFCHIMKRWWILATIPLPANVFSA